MRGLLEIESRASFCILLEVLLNFLRFLLFPELREIQILSDHTEACHAELCKI